MDQTTINFKQHLKQFSLFILLSTSVFYVSTTQAQNLSIKSSKTSKALDLHQGVQQESRMLMGTRHRSLYSNRGDLLFGRAVLPAASFAKGPTSGNYLGKDRINNQAVPFVDKQPIQGFSSVLNNFDGSFTALSDNGFGSLENSSDYNLRLYHIRPRFRTILKPRGGAIKIEGFTELSDPNNMIPFAIVNHFTKERILTGADFDIESIQRDSKGDYWIGDEFGPFVLHFDNQGVLLDPPFALPDFENPGQELRAPQNPYNEEYSAQRVMNAMRAHALANGSKAPVMSPWFVMLDDNNPETKVGDREGVSSEIHNVSSLNRAGHDVVVYTVNDLKNMNLLLELGVQGIISDRPDLLLEAVQNFDKNADGKADFVNEDGLIDVTLFDAQGHRGARNLRPENTLPAIEIALDNLMPTIETDTGITLDGIPVLDHDPHIEAAKTRKADGSTYTFEDEVLVKDLTLAEIQTTFIADKLLPDRPVQTNDRGLSPVSQDFAVQENLVDSYVIPSLQQVFDFVDFYKTYYQEGKGASHPEATKRWKNASRVRYNIETKINPRTDKDDRGVVFAERTMDPTYFTRAVANVIVANRLEDRADIQSFDFRTLLIAHKEYPQIRTVCLFGDFPKVGPAGDGTNIQDQNGENTPWLAGLYWPYRTTKLDAPFRVKGSGGFEGMALTNDKRTLLPLLEKPLVGADDSLLIHEFDLETKTYTGKRYQYPIDKRASAIGDFVMFGNKRGLIIERDGSQGDVNGFKVIYEIEINTENDTISKRLNLDLLKINDIRRISQPSLVGDVGVGKAFAFPFVTIESVVVFNPFLIGVLNDNNYPFSVGRHVGQGLPDDTEFILVWLDQPLGRSWGQQIPDSSVQDIVRVQAYPTIFREEVRFSGSVTTKKEVSIDIYNFQGVKVRELVDGDLVFDSFSYEWDGRNTAGRNTKSGVYMAIIKIGDQLFRKKIIKND